MTLKIKKNIQTFFKTKFKILKTLYLYTGAHKMGSIANNFFLMARQKKSFWFEIFLKVIWDGGRQVFLLTSLRD